MNKPLFAAIAGLALLSVAAPAAAAVNARQLNQQRLIDAGVRSGKLTPHEASVLRNEQRSIERAKGMAKMRHNGRYTAAAERRIHAMQDAAERHIQRLKYNGARR